MLRANFGILCITGQAILLLMLFLLLLRVLLIRVQFMNAYVYTSTTF